MWKAKTRNRERSTVIWTDKNSGKPAPFAKQLPAYKPGEDSSPSEWPLEMLTVGSLFVTCSPLHVDPRASDSQYPPLQLAKRTAATVPVGSMAIYAGPVRVEERHRGFGGKIVTVTRHTFVVASARYVVDLAYVKPALAL